MQAIVRIWDSDPGDEFYKYRTDTGSGPSSFNPRAMVAHLRAVADEIAEKYNVKT